MTNSYTSYFLQNKWRQDWGCWAPKTNRNSSYDSCTIFRVFCNHMKALFGEENYIFNHLSTKYDALYRSLTTSNVLSIMRARTDNVWHHKVIICMASEVSEFQENSHICKSNYNQCLSNHNFHPWSFTGTKILNLI